MMKTKLFTLVFAVLALGACKKEIKLDVKQIHLTDKTGQWDIKIDRPAFSTTDAETEKSCVKIQRRGQRADQRYSCSLYRTS